MAKKISELSESTTMLDAEVLPIVSNGATKKIKKENLLKEVNERIDDLEESGSEATAVVAADLAAHEADDENPHGVTAEQLGLEDVDNTSDAAKPVSILQAEEFVKTRPPALPRQAFPSETMLTMLASGHGWTKQGSPGTVDLNDTTDFAMGTQAIKITTDGAGGNVTVRGPALAAINMNDKCFRIWVKVEIYANLSSLALFAFSNSTSHSYRWTFAHGTDLYPLNQDGEWVEISLSWADATISGTPSRENITQFQFQAVDNGATPAVIHINGISAFDDGRSLYPNGVISINFDDNYDTQYTTARPILEAAGFRANFNVIADRIGQAGYMTLAQLKALHKSGGHEINCHAYTVANHDLNLVQLLATQGQGAVELELGNIKKWLVDNGFADGADLMVLPNGAYSPTVMQIYKKFFAYVRSIYSHQGQYVETLPPSNQHAIRSISGISSFSGGIDVTEVQTYINKVVAEKGWGILTFHRIKSVLNTNDCSAADFQTIVTALQASGVAVRPIGDVMRSMDAYSVNKKYVDQRAAEASVAEFGSRRKERKIVTTFQGSHGYTKQSVGGTQSNDTTDFVTGTQSLKLLTDGTAAACVTRKTGITPINLLGQSLEVLVKVDDTSKCAELWIYASSDDFAGSNWYSWKITDDISQMKSGVWTPITLSFGKATVTGTPNRAAITAFQLRANDAGAGAVTVNFGGIQYVAEPPEGIVTIQFDDNWDSVYTKAMPKLTELGLPAVIFTIAARVGTSGYMTEEQLRECQDVLKWDIANHSFNHSNFTTLSAAAAEDDMIRSRQWLRKRGFKAHDHWAWPNGAYDVATLLPLIKKYARSARTIASYAETLPAADNYKLRVLLVLDTTTTGEIQAAVTRAKVNKEWLILVYHKIVDSLTGGVTTEHLTASFNTEMADIVSQGIRVATLTDVLDRGNGEDTPFHNEGYYIRRKGNALVRNRRTITAAATLDESDDTVIVTSGTFTQPLLNPTLVAPNRELEIINKGTGVVTLSTPSGLIGSGSTLVLLTGDSVRLASDLTDWLIK